MLGTWVYLSATFHTQINDQVGSTIQILEDMLWDYVLDIGGQYDQIALGGVFVQQQLPLEYPDGPI